MHNPETPVQTLIEITKNLTSILIEEMECLNNQRPVEITKFQKQKNVLTASYHKELNDIIKCRKDTINNINITKQFLLKNNMPMNYIITENTTFGFNPKHTRIINYFNEFWNIYIQNQITYRDQPIWAYICWKNKLNIKILSNFKTDNIKTKDYLFEDNTFVDIVIFFNFYASRFL